MKIMTFNIRHGGGNRIAGILDCIQRHHSDVLVLTEYRENDKAIILRSGLTKLGYIYLAGGSLNPKVNSVLIASKKPFTSHSFENFREPANTKSLLGARFTGFNLIGGYFPGKDRKFPVFEYLLEKGNDFLSDLGLIVGDLNTGKHYLDEKGATFLGSEYLGRLEDSGLIDSWRSRNPDKTEYTWISNHGNGFRLDHVFSTQAFNSNITDIYYSHVERENKVSDHSVMIVEVKD